MARIVATRRQTARDFGTCLLFNGSSSLIAPTSSVSSTGIFTTLIWFNKRDTTANYCILGLTGTTVKLDFQFGGSLASIAFRVITGGSLLQANVGYSSSMDNSWHLLAVTRDGANNVSASLDGGALVSFGTVSGTFTFDQIGKNNGGEFFKGLLDNFIHIDGTTYTQANFQDYFYNGTILGTPSLYYKFDEGSGTSVTDSSASGNTGTITAATYSTNVFTSVRSVAGRKQVVRPFGTCQRFNGTSTKITFPDVGFNVLSAVTISLWAKIPTDFATRQQGLFNTAPSAVGDTRIYSDGSGNVSYDIGGSGGGNNVALSTLNGLYSSWSHWVLTIGPNNNDAILYYNGVLVSSGLGQTQGIKSNTFIIGNFNGGQWFGGLVDEIILQKNVTWTSQQVSDNFYTGAIPAGTVFLQAKLDEGSGSTATDSSGSGNNGVIANGNYSSDVFMVARTLA